MVLAAGLGTRLKPITFSVAKPMVPVLDRPVMAYLIDLLVKHGFTDAIANLHYFPDPIKNYFGDGSASGLNLTYEYEQELLGTAGGVRNVREFFGDEPFLVISGDALTDIDLTALMERHRSTGAVATLTVKHVSDTSEYGVVINDSQGRISGFQEKPNPAEALSDLGNCGIYVFSPEIFDYFPAEQFADWANDVFPALLAHDVPFFTHEIDDYWNDVGSIAELRQGTFDVIRGELNIDLPGIRQGADDVWIGPGSSLSDAALVEGPVWIGRDCKIGAGVSLQGPVVVGDRSRIGADAAMRDTIVFPDGEVAPSAVVVGALLGQGEIARIWAGQAVPAI